MAKADLLIWIKKHQAPLTGTCPAAKDPVGPYPAFPTDYNRFNAVANAAQARAALLSRVPPLTMADVDAAMVEYNK